AAAKGAAKTAAASENLGLGGQHEHRGRHHAAEQTDASHLILQCRVIPVGAMNAGRHVRVHIRREKNASEGRTAQGQLYSRPGTPDARGNKSRSINDIVRAELSLVFGQTFAVLSLQPAESTDLRGPGRRTVSACCNRLSALRSVTGAESCSPRCFPSGQSV